MRVSPTAEGFRAVFRRPSLTLGEITWRWIVGATSAVLLLFGLIEYFDSLTVTSGEALFLRTRNPYLMSSAVAHIFRGSLGRVAMAAIVAAMMLGLLWVLAASAGRMATVRALLDYFRKDRARHLSISDAEELQKEDSQQSHPWPTLVRLNFLRAAVTLAAACGLLGAAILAGFVSRENDLAVLAFFVFVLLAGSIGLAWGLLNWILSLAGMFAVRDGDDTMGAISSAVSLCRERAAAVLAVSTWTGLAHVAIFTAAMTAVSLPLAFAGVVPWRLIVLVMVLMTLAYFAVADWLYMARLAGYVCIADTPEALLNPPALTPRPIFPHGMQDSQPSSLQTAIDREELILSDMVVPPRETTIDRDELILSDQDSATE